MYRFIVKTPQKQGAYFPGETLSPQSSLTQDLTMDDGKLRVFPWRQYFFSHRGKETRHTTFIEDFPTHYLNIYIYILRAIFVRSHSSTPFLPGRIKGLKPLGEVANQRFRQSQYSSYQSSSSQSLRIAPS